MVSIQITGLDELRKKYAGAQKELDRGLKVTLDASLTILHENVPAYPRQSQDTRYKRTGTLGRSLGASFQGGASSGKPDIYTVKKEGAHGYVGEFGTRLKYAPYVIGEKEQAWMHQGRWWTIGTIAKNALPKIQRAFAALTEQLAKWLDK